jgi:hypothetical protein
MNSRKQTPRAGARTAQRQTPRESTSAEFRPIGSFVSSATRAQLLGMLKQFKPQFNARLRELEQHQATHHYQLEVDVRDLQRQHLIDPWLGIKSALTSAFPINKPGAVRRLKP